MASELELGAQPGTQVDAWAQARRAAAGRVNWRHVGLFVGITFLVTFVLDLALHLIAGYGSNIPTTVLLQLQMLIPATVAIVLQMFVFRNSSIYHLRGAPAWFFYYYVFYVAVFILGAIALILSPEQVVLIVVNAALQLLLLAGLVLLVILRLVGGKEAFRRAGLAGGKVWHYLAFGLFIVGIYALLMALNAMFGLGQAVDPTPLMAGTPLASLPRPVILLILALQVVGLNPILALFFGFGEEYGWRGYLQGELVKLGKMRGILLVGVIWGVWHIPIIVMGHNYPGYPVLGSVLMVVYTVALGFVLGFAVFKTGSIWLAAFLHILNNAVASFFLGMVYAPNDPVWSFGIGLYSLPVWALVMAGLLLIWRRDWLSSPAKAGAPGAVPVESERSES